MFWISDIPNNFAHAFCIQYNRQGGYLLHPGNPIESHRVLGHMLAEEGEAVPIEIDRRRAQTLVFSERQKEGLQLGFFP